MSARRKGEVVSLQCARCGWSNEVPLRDTADSAVIACVHCSAHIYWHRCARCDLRYLGAADPACPLCDGAPPDQDFELA